MLDLSTGMDYFWLAFPQLFWGGAIVLTLWAGFACFRLWRCLDRWEATWPALADEQLAELREVRQQLAEGNHLVHQAQRRCSRHWFVGVLNGFQHPLTNRLSVWIRNKLLSVSPTTATIADDSVLS